LWCGALKRTLPLPEKRDDKDHAGNQEKHAAKHRPEMPDAGNDKAYRREDKQNPSQKVDLAVADAAFSVGFAVESKCHGLGPEIGRSRPL
jgi:hypothetical protein